MIMRGSARAGPTAWRFWEVYISETVRPIDNRSSVQGNPIPSTVYETNTYSYEQ